MALQICTRKGVAVELVPHRVPRESKGISETDVAS